MNKVMPYLFWIITGVLLLVEIVLLLAVSPTAPDGSSPQKVKDDVDQYKKTLDLLVGQAKHGSPGGSVFDPLDKTQMTKLMNEYLDTPAWKRPLDDELTLYTEQMTKIRVYLVERSKSLHEPISTAADFAWYEDYKNATAELLQGMYDNKCILLPAKNRYGPGAGGAMGMPGALMSAPTPVAAGSGSGARTPSSGTAGDADPDDAAPDFKTNKDNRHVAGFLTRDKDFPPAEPQGGVYTTQFRIMQEIASVLEAAKATNTVSPVAPQRQPYEEHAKLVSTTFAGADEEVQTVTLLLQGPLSAVLAAEAAMEENRDESQPIRVVLSGSLERKTYVSEERLHVSSEPVWLHLTVAILDFDAMKNETVDFHPAPGSKPAASKR